MRYTVGIDMGGTNTDIGLVSDDGRIVQRISLQTSAYTRFNEYVRDLMGCIAHIEEQQAQADGERPDTRGIGIGAPDSNYYTGCIVDAPNLTMKGTLNFGTEIRKHRDVAVVLDNDANAAAYGEYIYGGARGMRHYIMVTLGTGVGSGVVVDGRIVHGATGAAGELGHSILMPGGRRCACGREGCLETYASAGGIVRTYCELKGLASADGISCKQVGELARAGDTVALRAWEVVADQLGLALANSVSITSPEAIFLMGGPAQVGEPLLRPLRAAFERYLLFLYKGTCQIRMSEMPSNDVAILGAASLVNMKEI